MEISNTKYDPVKIGKVQYNTSITKYTIETIFWKFVNRPPFFKEYYIYKHEHKIKTLLESLEKGSCIQRTTSNTYPNNNALRYIIHSKHTNNLKIGNGFTYICGDYYGDEIPKFVLPVEIRLPYASKIVKNTKIKFNDYYNIMIYKRSKKLYLTFYITKNDKNIKEIQKSIRLNPESYEILFNCLYLFIHSSVDVFSNYIDINYVMTKNTIKKSDLECQEDLYYHSKKFKSAFIYAILNMLIMWNIIKNTKPIKILG
jgi:hypothetical protein